MSAGTNTSGRAKRAFACAFGPRFQANPPAPFQIAAPGRPLLQPLAFRSCDDSLSGTSAARRQERTIRVCVIPLYADACISRRLIQPSARPAAAPEIAFNRSASSTSKPRGTGPIILPLDTPDNPALRLRPPRRGHTRIPCRAPAASPRHSANRAGASGPAGLSLREYPGGPSPNRHRPPRSISGAQARIGPLPGPVEVDLLRAIRQNSQALPSAATASGQCVGIGIAHVFARQNHQAVGNKKPPHPRPLPTSALANTAPASGSLPPNALNEGRSPNHNGSSPVGS